MLFIHIECQIPVVEPYDAIYIGSGGTPLLPHSWWCHLGSHLLSTDHSVAHTV